MRLLPYRSHRVDWPSGWYVEYVVDWTIVGLGFDFAIRTETIYGREYAFDLQLGPLYLDGGFCVRAAPSTATPEPDASRAALSVPHPKEK